MKQNIAIDFDDVIVKTSEDILNELGLFFNETYDINMLKHYNISRDLGINESIVRDAIDIALTNVCLTIEKDSADIIKWLSEMYNIHIVTSRLPEFIEHVEWNLLNHRIDNYITDIHSDIIKTDTLKKLDAKVFIEDNPVYITNSGINTLLYSKPWNKNINNSLSVYRVNNWKEIKDWFILYIGGNSESN